MATKAMPAVPIRTQKVHLPVGPDWANGHSEMTLRARGRHRLTWGAMTQRRGVANHPSIARANTLAQLCNPVLVSLRERHGRNSESAQLEG